MTDLNTMLDDYLALLAEIHKYFDYRENWRVIPIDDRRGLWWYINGSDSSGMVIFQHNDASYSQEVLRDGQYYKDEIYTQRFLLKWVYRTATHTMICVDTHTDMNKFLAIFDNALEVPEEKRVDPDELE
jgi:hypothetical protein